MKILQVITSLQIGGAEKLVVDMVPLMRKEGHSVDILLFNGVDTSFKKQLQEQGIRIFSFGYGSSVYNPKFIFRLIPIIKQYDIVHAHNTACQYFVAIAKFLVFENKTIIVTTEHSTNNRRRKIFGFKHFDKWMYSQYNAIVTISDKATENLIGFLNNRYPIFTIYNGINIQNFIYNNPIDRETFNSTRHDDIVVCMIAGFRIEKDQDTLIKAMKLLPDNYKLWLVGDGVRRTELEELVKSLNLYNRVFFSGIRSDIPQILKASDIIVMSSHWEGLSLSSLEGMSVGKPFIASDVDGLHETVNGYGLLFPHEDYQTLVKIILDLIKDKDYYKRVSDACLNRALQFDVQNTVNRYLNLYQRIYNKTEL